MNTLIKLCSLAAAVALPCAPLIICGQGSPSYIYSEDGNLQSVNASTSSPTIITAPQSTVLQLNSLATFSVVAGGSGLSYQWLSNGVPISGATGDSLIVMNLPLIGTNLGNFSVIVSNSHGSITSTPAALWPDANGNGIPDWWEMTYFGNLNQSAEGDFDGDGVNNFNEYIEGTNPANAASFNPRLKITAAHGTVSVSPLQPYYTNGQFVTLTASPDPGHQFVAWSGSVSGTKPQVTVLMDTNKAVTAFFGFPIPIAVDNPALLWTTGGDLPWFGQAETSYDGSGAAQSGPIVSTWNGSAFVGEQSWLQTVVDTNVPSQLSFWWNVSSRPPNALTFSLDGTTLASISGEAVGWQFVQTNLTATRHVLTWTYTKGPVDIPTGIPFADSGWVDQVAVTTAGSGIQSPLLSIVMATTNSAVISWTSPFTNFVLQQNPAFNTANWVNVTNAVATVTNHSQVSINSAASHMFYRLEYQ